MLGILSFRCGRRIKKPHTFANIFVPQVPYSEAAVLSFSLQTMKLVKPIIILGKKER